MPELAIDHSRNEPPKIVPKPERRLDFETQLREGYYANIKLEGYMAENTWRREIVARDILQNFFDANGYTLDGVRIDLEEKAESTVVTIRADQSYPYQRVVSFGSGYKENTSRSAGGKHQGTKDVIVMLLREYGCETVQYESEDWRLDCYKEELPSVLKEKAANQKEHGVFFKLTDREQTDGNLLRFETRDRAMAEAMIDARDLFSHSSNPDFQHPDIETEKAGYRLLAEGEKGNFYLNGQRISYDTRGDWHTIPRFTFWSKETPTHAGKKIELSRDRDLLTYFDISTFLPFLTESMSAEQQHLTLSLLSDFHENKPDVTSAIGKQLVRLCIEAMARRQERISFHPSELADDLEDKKGMVEALKQKNYRLCLPEFAKIGMKKASELLTRLELEQTVELSEGEQKRSALLQQMIGTFLEDAPRLKLKPKSIQAFAGNHPLEGQYDTEFIWMNRRSLSRAEPSQTISTYLHELSHAFGSDMSAEFSYKLTDVLTEWTRYLMNHPELLPEFARAWSEIPVEKRTTSLPELLARARPLIEQEHLVLFSSPERLDRQDRRINKMAEPFLDLMQTQFQEPFTFEHVMSVWEQMQKDPAVLRMRKIEATLDLSDNEVVELEYELRGKNKKYMQLQDRCRYFLQEIRLLKEKRARNKHRPSKEEKEMEVALKFWEQQKKQCVLERQELEEQLPSTENFISAVTRVTVFDQTFAIEDAISEHIFFLTAARVLHVSLPQNKMSPEATEQTLEGIKACYQAIERINFLRSQRNNRFFSASKLTQELELHLSLASQFPSVSNIRIGELLCEEIVRLRERNTEALDFA